MLVQSRIEYIVARSTNLFSFNLTLRPLLTGEGWGEVCYN